MALYEQEDKSDAADKESADRNQYKMDFARCKVKNSRLLAAGDQPVAVNALQNSGLANSRKLRIQNQSRRI